MRTKKSRGKKRATVTLTESEIVAACRQYLESKGFVLGNTCYVGLPKDSTKLRYLSFKAELENDPDNN